MRRRRESYGDRENRFGNRGHNRGGNQRGYKRKRDYNDRGDFNKQPDLSADERLRKLLIRVGEKSKASLSKNLDGLAKAVQVDLSQYEDLILNTLFDCIVHLGVKIPIHATLVGLITIWEPDFGSKVLQRLKDGFIDSISKGDVFKLRHYVRFLGCLQNSNVIVHADYARILKQLLEFVKNDDMKQRDRDHIAHIIMGGIAFSGKSLASYCTAELTQIQDALKVYIEETRDSSPSKHLQIASTQNITFLEDYWNGLLKAEENNWEIESILTPQNEFERLKQCQQQAFLIDLPEWHSPATLASVNSFGVLKLVEVEEPLPLIEHCIVCEYLHDLMRVFATSPNHTADHIINLPVHFDHKFLAMEAIFSYMLSIPSPEQEYIYYARIITELFDKQPKLWPKAVGRCLLHLFENMENLDIEVRYRLARWFAFHLNNFGNNWPWHKWNFVVNLDENSPKRQFCTMVLRLQVQLSEWGRVMNSVQEPFNELMPDPPTHSMKYKTKVLDAMDTGEKSTDQLAADLQRMLNRKNSLEDIQKYLETWFVPATHGKYGAAEIFFTCLLQVGHSSYSHFLSHFKAYQQILRDYTPDEDSKLVLLRSLHSFWFKSQDRIVVLIEKLHQYKLINSTAIVRFVFEKENIPKHTDSFWMQLLCMSLDRVFLTHNGLSAKRELIDQKMNLENQVDLEPKLQQINAALERLKPMLLQILLHVFRGFKLALEIVEDDEKDYTKKAVEGNMVWIMRKYSENIAPHRDEIHKELFTDSEDKISELWNSI